MPFPRSRTGSPCLVGSHFASLVLPQPYMTPGPRHIGGGQPAWRPRRGIAASSRTSRLFVVHSRCRTIALLEACGRNLDACKGPLNVLHQPEECRAYSVGKYQGIGPDSDEN